MVCESTLSIFGNLGKQLKGFEVFRNEPVTFEGIDFDFYDRFAKYLTFDYVQKRRKLGVKGLKQILYGRLWFNCGALSMTARIGT